MDWVDTKPHTHYNPHTGLPCNCGWGEKKKGKRKRTSSVNLRRIRKQDQKIFRDEQGKAYLDHLESYAERSPGIEPLIPWLASRYKHGEFSPAESGLYTDPVITVNSTGLRLDRFLPDWIQWMNARNHPLRRGRNIMEMSAQELHQTATELAEDVKTRQKKQNWINDYRHTGSHALRFGPDLPYLHDEYQEMNENYAHHNGPEVKCPSCGHFGTPMAGECRRCDTEIPPADYVSDLLRKHQGWTVRQLNSGEDCEAESAANGHCIGSDDQPYKRAIQDGHIEAYSLRDPDGYPAVSWHYNPDGTLAHIQGRGGYPKEDYRNLISLYNLHTGKDDDGGGEGGEQDLDELNYDAQVHLPTPETAEGYAEQYHPDFNYHEWASEYADNGVGEDTEVIQGEPQWESIYNDLRERPEKERQNFYQTVLYNNYNRHHQGWGQEIEAWRKLHPEDLDPIDHQIHAEWDQAFDRSHNEYGRLEGPVMDWTTPGGRWLTPWHQFNTPLFTEQRELSPQNAAPASQLWAPGRGYPPNLRPDGTFSRTANILDPIHNTLPPEVWDHPGDPRPKLKDMHRKWIMREAYALASKFESDPEAWLKLVLTGSLTTYQYAETSDCDISLFVDAFKLPEWDRGRLIGLMVANMDGTKLPGTPFDMQCFVVPKNIHASDLYQPGLRSGYDLLSDSWLVPPDRSRVHDVEREYNTDYVYALESADKMERLLRYDPDKAVQFWHQIHQRRRRDQQAGKGDYSQANIVYKFLANRGLFPQLSEVSGEYIA